MVGYVRELDAVNEALAEKKARNTVPADGKGAAPVDITGVDYGHGCLATPEEAKRRVVITFQIESALNAPDFDPADFTDYVRKVMGMDAGDAVDYTASWIEGE